MTVEKLQNISAANGFKLFEFNLLGERRNSAPNTFDDIMHVFFKRGSDWFYRSFPMTTEPGKYWLENPMNSLGTSIVKSGIQFIDLWMQGKHQGKYDALIQANRITVIRDNDKDGSAETQGGKEYTGMFGINCHRASDNGGSINVEKWSAGCQVLQNRYITNPDNQSIKVYEFDYFLHLTRESKFKYFSYAVLDANKFI